MKVDIETIKTREFQAKDISLKNEFLTQLVDGSWVEMKIRDLKDISTIVKTFEKHKRVVELMNSGAFSEAGFYKATITLPEWYNVTDDTEVYKAMVDQEALEVPIFVYHPEDGKLSMFVLNKTQYVKQLYQIFIGVPCETVNDFYDILRMFINNEKKAAN